MTEEAEWEDRGEHAVGDTSRGRGEGEGEKGEEEEGRQVTVELGVLALFHQLHVQSILAAFLHQHIPKQYI